MLMSFHSFCLPFIFMFSSLLLVLSFHVLSLLKSSHLHCTLLFVILSVLSASFVITLPLFPVTVFPRASSHLDILLVFSTHNPFSCSLFFVIPFLVVSSYHLAILISYIFIFILLFIQSTIFSSFLRFLSNHLQSSPVIFVSTFYNFSIFLPSSSSFLFPFSSL